MKRIILLGATGSIGSSALDVVREHPHDFQIVALAVKTNLSRAEELAREFHARCYAGEDSACQAVLENKADICLVATVGLSGLKPTLLAIDKGMDIALATKEVLVAAGALVTARARAKGVRLLPVDSEHSAIFQCLQGSGRAERVLLTCSGGPFLTARVDLSHVTPADALNHPRWKMGPKVTIDSATMMNKGFEVLEAHWLFDMPSTQIDVVVHPESIVHSLVTFEDGSTLAQLAPPDMRVPILYALSWPDRLRAVKRARLDLASLGRMTFSKPDLWRFPCLALAYEVCKMGGLASAILSAADEVAVSRFLEGSLKYLDIPNLLSDAIRVKRVSCVSPTLEDILEADYWARDFAAFWKPKF